MASPDRGARLDDGLGGGARLADPGTPRRIQLVGRLAIAALTGSAVAGHWTVWAAVAGLPVFGFVAGWSWRGWLDARWFGRELGEVRRILRRQGVSR